MKHTQSSKDGLSRMAAVVLAGLMAVATNGARGEEKPTPMESMAVDRYRKVSKGRTL